MPEAAVSPAVLRLPKATVPSEHPRSIGCDDADQVGNRHQPVEGIAQVNGQGNVHGRADQHHGDKDDLIRQGGLGAEKILPGLGAVVAPAQNRREGEEADRHGHENAAEGSEGFGEGFRRQPQLGGAGDGSAGLQIHHAGGQNDQRGAGADDDGIRKDFEDAPETLNHGLLHVGGGVNHDGGAEAGLVGENAPLEAPGHGLGDHGPADAAGGGFKVEGAGKNGSEGRRNPADVHADDDQGADDKEDGHEGHDALVGGGDPLQPADNHQRQKHDDHDAGDQIHRAGIRGNQRVDALGDGSHLAHVADAEGSQHREDGEQHGQHRAGNLAVLHLADAVLQIVHGAAAPFAPLIPAAEEKAQHVFRIIGHHADDGGDPHPENGAGAAHGNGVGHAGDVSRADGGGQGGAQGLELGDGMPVVAVANSFFLLEQTPDGVGPHVAEAAELEEPGQHGHQNAGADQEHQRGNAPDHAVDGVIDGSYSLRETIHTNHPFRVKK